MASEPFEQLASTIFEEALELPPSQRDAWVAEKCGDDAGLCKEVRQLLAAHERAGGILDQPVHQIYGAQIA